MDSLSSFPYALLASSTHHFNITNRDTCCVALHRNQVSETNQITIAQKVTTK